MNLTVERATRLACSEEVAASEPSLAAAFEKCAEIKRAARARGRIFGCRAGCTKDRASLNQVGESVLRFLSSASDSQVQSVKARLGADTIRFSVDGAVFER